MRELTHSSSSSNGFLYVLLDVYRETGLANMLPQITTFACMNIAINLGAFEAIETHGSMSAKQLAASLNADKEMISPPTLQRFLVTLTINSTSLEL